MVAGFVVVCAVGHELRAEVPDGLGLAGVGVGGQSDYGMAAEESACIGDGLAKVAGGCNGNALLQLFRGEVGDGVQATPDLEGADGGVVFVLDVGLGAEKGVEAWVVVEGGGGHVPLEQRVGLGDGLDVCCVGHWVALREALSSSMEALPPD